MLKPGKACAACCPCGKSADPSQLSSRINSRGAPLDRQLPSTGSEILMEGIRSHRNLRGHIKSGQRWSLQNRPTEVGLGLGCFTPLPPEEASLFSCANSVDRI